MDLNGEGGAREIRELKDFTTFFNVSNIKYVLIVNKFHNL